MILSVGIFLLDLSELGVVHGVDLFNADFVAVGFVGCVTLTSWFSTDFSSFVFSFLRRGCVYNTDTFLVRVESFLNSVICVL